MCLATEATDNERHSSSSAQVSIFLKEQSKTYNTRQTTPKVSIVEQLSSQNTTCYKPLYEQNMPVH